MNSNNRPYEYEGEVHQVLPLQTFQSGFAKRTLILVKDPMAQYQDFAAFDFFKGKKGDDTQKIANLAVGQKVKVKFYLGANESKTRPGSWFPSVRGVDIECGDMHEINIRETPKAEEEPMIDDGMPF